MAKEIGEKPACRAVSIFLITFHMNVTDQTNMVATYRAIKKSLRT
jgi:hypothetical protein